MRSLMSRPLALTLFTSNVQRHVPPLPAARAKPVMLLTAIAAPSPGRIAAPRVHERADRPNPATGPRGAAHLA